MKSRIALILGLAALAPGVARAQATDCSEAGLTVSLDTLTGFSGGPVAEGGQVRASWSGDLEGRSVEARLYFLPLETFRFTDPADVVELSASHRADQDAEASRPELVLESSRGMSGSYGYVTYGWLGVGGARKGTQAIESYFCLGGLLEEYGYALEISARPALTDEGVATIERFLADGVRYEGPQQDPEWTEEEAEARWLAQAPDSVLEDSELRVQRSEHYVILTNVGKGTARGFAEKIDECYEEIKAVYPFEDFEGQRFLPIFYFVTSEQYHEWYAKNLDTPIEQARRSGGVAYGDVYATYHQATNAPVHIHEATHQIFKNRLRLGGGGSWFQEGVAEYMSSTANDLGGFKSRVKRENFVPFREFFTLKSLLYSADPERVTGGSEAGDSYDQAAALVEFVRHGKYSEKFQDFVHAIGAVRRRDLEAIEGELQRLFGRDVDGFQEDFVEYWTKRKRPRKK